MKFPKLFRIASRGEAGQAAVEFGLLIPLFTIVLLIIVNFGFVFSSYITMIHGAREGSRMAAVAGSGFNATAVKSRVVEASSGLVSASDVRISFVDRNSNGQATNMGDSVRVMVCQTVDLLAPSFMGFNPTVNLKTRADMRLEQMVTATSEASC